jgi:hypothetical protein
MLVESKSNLARLMASENLIVEQKNVHTAMFDTKNRVLTVPLLNGNLSPEVYDLLLGHEVGHALETPTEGWHHSVIDLKVNRSILNVCEDVRIEKKIKRKFPGIRISFVKGYQELMDLDFFGVKGRNLNRLNFIDRINLYTKGGAAQIIDFTTEETVLLREVEVAETFEETVAAAKKIQAFMRMKKEEQPKYPKPEKGEAGEKSEEETEDSGQSEGDFEFDTDSQEEIEPTGGKGQDGEEKEGEIESPDGEGEQPETPETKENKQDSEENGKQGGTEGSDDSEQSLESETDNSFREKEKELFDTKNKRDMKYANIPKINTKHIIVGYKTILNEITKHNLTGYSGAIKDYYNLAVMKSNFQKFRTESNKVVSYLVKEFEMRKNAEQQSRAKISKTGELNLSKIHEYKFTDDIFARMTKVPNGKSHGLVMFIDWSGSMQDHINATVKQLLNIAMFCKKVSIPFDVYAFSTHVDPDRESDKQQADKVGDIKISEFSLLNILSHKMNATEFTSMASHLLDFGTTNGRRYACKNFEPPEILHLSGTPLNEVIIAAFELVPEFRKENKLEIVNTVILTDGEGSTVRGRIYAMEMHKYHKKEHSFTEYMDPDNRKRCFFRDPVTKATSEIVLSSGYGSRGHAQTVALLKLLKQRIDSNLIGFYVTNVREARRAMELYMPEKSSHLIEKKVSEFRKNNFTYLDCAGYDEYYFLRSDKLDTDEDSEFEVTSTTTRGMVSAFSKYTGNKVSSRVVLNRFINLIA